MCLLAVVAHIQTGMNELVQTKHAWCLPAIRNYFINKAVVLLPPACGAIEPNVGLLEPGVTHDDGSGQGKTSPAAKIMISPSASNSLQKSATASCL